MSVFIFTGPTISADEGGRELKATYLPPAAEGDVYRAALQQPRAIGIIDGYFQSVPAVRHKEILWTMSRGIHVFGSASMGALRAAELTAFGMEGVGVIFELYRDGILEDDDEVTVAHGPAETGYRPGSEAMVNIRQTFREAERCRIISAEFRTALEKIGKELFYPDRSYSLLLRRASESGLADTELARLANWLPKNRINQKKQDAIAMLRLMHRRLARRLKPKQVAFNFQHTVIWESALHQSGRLMPDSRDSGLTIGFQSILDELRLQGDRYNRVCLAARERFFADREADRLRITIGPAQRKRIEGEFRKQRELARARQLKRWQKENRLESVEFEELMIEEARLNWVRQRAQTVLANTLSQQLRVSGEYPRLLARAVTKEKALQTIGLKNPCLQTVGLTESELWRWHFEKVLRQPVPADVAAYARNLGYAAPDGFRRTLVKEYLYHRFCTNASMKRTR
jgi:hypothetical protein